MKHIILNVAHLLLHITFFIPVFNLLHIFLDEKVEIGKKLRATVALEEKLRQKSGSTCLGMEYLDLEIRKTSLAFKFYA